MGGRVFRPLAPGRHDLLIDPKSSSKTRNRTSTALAVGVLVLFWLPVLIPGRVLASRDVHFLHLPLRAALANGIASGAPAWNPWVHGGQPLLANPQVAAFYPPGWLALVFPADLALGLLAAAHAGWLAWGTFRLLRRLGTTHPVACFAAVATSCSGAFVGLLGLYNIFCGMAWAPWVLAAAHRLLAPRPDEQPSAPRLALAGSFALAVLADAATTPFLLLLLVAGLALGAPNLTLSARLRPFGPLLLGLGLAAVQLVPAAVQASDSPRSGGLASERATTWSSPPARAVELLVPHALGDPTRDEEGLYLGWGIHDKDYPLVNALYPGASVLALGLAGLCVLPVPYRRGLLLITVLATLLALGRHTPVYGLLAALPPLSLIRYPEKFALVPAFALALAAALAIHELRRPEAASRGIRFALVVLTLQGLAALALLLASTLRSAPLLSFLGRHAGRPLAEPFTSRLLAFLTSAAASTLVVVAISAALLWLLRRDPRGRRGDLLGVLLVATLGIDLWLAHRNLVVTLEREHLAAPPLALAALAGRDPQTPRIFTNMAHDPRPEVGLPIGPVGFQQYLGRLSRLDPQAAGMWGLAYALEEDFDLSLTRSARRALAMLHATWKDGGDPARPELPGQPAKRILGAWGVGQLVMRNGPSELRAALLERRTPAYGRLEVNDEAMAWIRPLQVWVAHPTLDAAVAAARRNAFAFEGRDHVLDTTRTGAFDCAPSSVDKAAQGGGRLTIDLEPPSQASANGAPSAPGDHAAATQDHCLIVAITFHENWTATSNAKELALYETALGYMALRVPFGTHRVELTYRDPWLRIGAASSALVALVMFAAARRARRRSTLNA